MDRTSGFGPDNGGSNPSQPIMGNSVWYYVGVVITENPCNKEKLHKQLDKIAYIAQGINLEVNYLGKNGEYDRGYVFPNHSGAFVFEKTALMNKLISDSIIVELSNFKAEICN